MTPEDVDAELDRLRQEIAVIVLNLRAEMTAIDLLRSRMRGES